MQLPQHLDYMLILLLACAGAGSGERAAASRHVGGEPQVRGAGKPAGQGKHQPIRPQPARQSDLLARRRPYKGVFISHPEGFGIAKAMPYTRLRGRERRSAAPLGLVCQSNSGESELVNKDGTWWISSQGQARRPDVEGAGYIPQFDIRQSVKTQDNYGYGAGVAIELDANAHRVTRLIAGETLPLARRRDDKSLPRPNFKIREERSDE